MKKENQRLMCDFLLNNGIQNMVGVPDSTLEFLIEHGLKEKKLLLRPEKKRQ